LLQAGVWTDTAFDPSRMSTTPVGFGSDDYFNLLAARPEWGDYLALGSRVIFVAEGTAYEVVEGETGPVELPATRTPEVEPPTVEPSQADQPTAEPSQPSQPTATPVTGGEAASTGPGGGLCAGAAAMATIALAATALWQRTHLPESW
jgi:hypothetical protein